LPQGVTQQVAVQLTKAAIDGLNRFSIQLHPADLGQVHVRLDISHDGHITAMVSSNRHDTLDLLQRDSQNLQRSLEDLGFKMDSGGMQFSLNNQGETYGQTAQSGLGGSGGDLTAPEQDLSQTVIAAAATTGVSDRALDIRV
jgi:flagellar hook-length control protein FliK